MSSDERFREIWARLVLDDDPIIRRTAIEAAKYPSLRRMYPFASLQNLRFSRRTQHPFELRLPHIRYEFGRFHAVDSDGNILLTGDLEVVVARVALEMESIHIGNDSGPPR